MLRPFRAVRRHARRRGMSLATVLGIVSVLAILTSAFMALFINNLNLMQACSNGELAQCEAEAGVAEVVARLNADPDLGVTTKPTFRSTLTRGLTSKDAFHQVTFDRSKKPYSTNNQGTDNDPKGTYPTGYLNRQLPPDSVHIMSQGYCLGQYRTVEALVLHPTFPYALATDGDIVSAANLSVLGTSSALALNTYDRPGHVCSNGRIELTGNVHITGTARAADGINITQGKVDGGLLAYSAPISLPFIPTSHYDPPVGLTPQYLTGGSPGLVEINGPLLLPYSGYVRCNDNLVFHTAVRIDQALLRCDKNVTFEQGLSGSGGVVADGNITVLGMNAMANPNDRLALVSAGSVQVSKAGTYYGLLYAQKGLAVDNTVIIGTALASGPAGQPKATITLNNVTAVSAPDILAPYFVVKNKWFLGLWVRPKKRKWITVYPVGPDWKFSMNTFITAADRFRISYNRIYNGKI